MRRLQRLQLLKLLLIALVSAEVPQNCVASSTAKTEARTSRVQRNVHHPNREIATQGKPTPHDAKVDIAERDRDTQELGESHLPLLYGILTRQAMGRYIFAVSSLLGECARVYSPEPVSSVLSTLQDTLDGFVEQIGQRRSTRPTQFQGNKPLHRGSSLDVENDDLVLDKQVLHSLEKYGRVSNAFLRRHALGGLIESLDESIAVDSSVKVEDRSLAGNPSSDKSVQHDHRQMGSLPQLGSQRGSRSFLGFRKSRRVVDDEELLSQSKEFDMSPYAPGDREMLRPRVPNHERPEERSTSLVGPGGTNQTYAEAVDPIVQDVRKRNLMDAADDASELIQKMRNRRT